MAVCSILTSDSRRLALLLGGGAAALPRSASMATYTFPPAAPLTADGTVLGRVLQQAGVTKTSVVRVTGPAGPTAVLWLCRHGYERAAYVHANWIATMVSVDALLIPHTCGLEELADLLQGGDCLREGGVLIVQTRAGQFVEGLDSVSAVLEPLGYQVERRVSDKGRDIHIARRRGLGGFKKAA
jgi:hypothetical protein